MRRGLVALTLALGLLPTSVLCWAGPQEGDENPFTAAVIETYDGVFVGDGVRMKVAPTSVGFEGEIRRGARDLPFEAVLEDGELRGVFTERAETFAFTARADGDVLQVDAGTFSAVLRRVQHEDFAGDYRSRKVRLSVHTDGSAFTGRIEFSGQTYPFAGRLVDGALCGTFRNGDAAHEFVLEPRSSRSYSFKTGAFAETLTKPRPGEITEEERLAGAELIVEERSAAERSEQRARYRAVVDREMPGMTFLRLEQFTSVGETHEVALYEHQATGLEFVLIPGGTFLMGDREFEHTRPHAVSVAKPFFLCRTEVTQAAWDRIGGEDERTFHGAELPIEGITGEAVLDWCKRAGLRLPTEAEWELACRAGTKGRFNCGGNEERLFEHAWLAENSRRRTHPVARKRTNGFGLHDMHGNVSEWCLAAYDASSLDTVVVDPGNGTSDEPAFCFRGGNWQSFPREARSGFRFPWFAEGGMSVLGFRPALSVD